MIEGIGIDIIEIDRIKNSLKNNNRIIDRVLTKAERRTFDQINSERRKLEYIAGRFAAKEAFAKATGQGIGKLSFQHIEILADEKGAPIITAKEFNGYTIFLSISHSEHYAVAQVIIEKK